MEKRRSISVVSYLTVLGLLTVGGSLAAAELPEYLKLVCPFEEGLYACQGATNPFSAAGHVTLVPGGDGRGKAARFAGQDLGQAGLVKRPSDKSAMVFDGGNIPVEKGTVAFSMRWSGKRHASDAQRTWLLVIVPQVGDSQTITVDNGTGLAVFKDKDNSLVLGVYQFYDKRLTPGFRSRKSGFEIAEPDQIAARIPMHSIPKAAWARIRVSWDRKAGKVWLGLNDELKSAESRFRKAPWMVLLVGTPPRLNWAKARGFDGDLDDLVVDARTPAEAKRAGFELPDRLPPMAQPPKGRAPAIHLRDDPVGARMESVVRSHLANVLRLQEAHGGWAFSAAWPSRLWFLSSKMVIPHTRNFFNGSKAGNSACCAFRVLSGYMALGDKQYLESAERTAGALLKLQYPDGHWPYCAVYDPEKEAFVWVLRPDLGPLEDHVQSHPTCLLWVLHALTGKEEYKVAADKGRDFIFRAQNPNGSWSHHYNTKLKSGQAARGYLRAGEVNDYTTSDQMLVMLVSYRRTGNIKYLASYLRGADWLVSAFIDKKAKGWAQQYDEHNKPIEARHFEPAAVGLSEGTHSAPRRLLEAYRLTGDRRYLEPCLKWRAWMMENRIFLNKDKTEWGWHTYYDIETGEPFTYAKRKRLKPDPRSVREGGFTAILRGIERIDEPQRAIGSPAERARRILEAEEKAKERTNEPVFNRLRPMPLVEAFDWHAGSWPFGQGNPTGQIISPSTVRVALVGWSVFIRRQIKGQIPWDHPMSWLNRYQWGSPFYYVVPPHELDKRLTKEEIANARAYIKAHPIKVEEVKTVKKPTPSAVAALTLAAALAAAEGPNLLKNPDLRIDEKSGKITQWDADNEPKRLEPESAPEGLETCLRVDIKSTDKQPGYIVQSYRLPKKNPPKSMVLSGWSRSTLPNIGYLQVKLYQGRKRVAIVSFGHSKKEWQRHAKLFSVEGLTSVIVHCRYTRLGAAVGQTVWFAGVSLQASEEEAPSAIRKPLDLSNKKVVVVVLGDSTVCDFSPASDKRGWGQMIGESFKPDVGIANHAKSGRSSKSFITEGLLDKALAVKAQYALIQFGHNDSHAKTEPKATDAAADFKEYLEQYIGKFRAKGVEPILVTPMHRRTFRSNGTLSDNLLPYAKAMKEVGEKRHVPVVDLHKMSGELFLKLGDKGSADLSCSAADRSHFSPKGAREMARLVVKGLTEVKSPLADWIKPDVRESLAK